jgi:hypothetical protein
MPKAEAISSYTNMFRIQRPNTLSKDKQAVTFKGIFEDTYNYQFVCDNGLDVYASADNQSFVANVPISIMPIHTQEYWKYLCSMLGVPVVSYCCQQFFDDLYCFKYAVVPKIVKFYSETDQCDRIGVKIGVDSSSSHSIIVPIEYESQGEVIDQQTGKRSIGLKYHINGNKMSLRWIPLDEKVQKLYNATGYFEVVLTDKDRYCNYSFKIDIDTDTNEVATEDEFLELWIEGQIVSYVKSSGHIYASFATIFGNLFTNGTFPSTGIFFGVKNGTRDNTNFGTCWEVVTPPEFLNLEVVINKNGEVGYLKDVSKLYVTDSSPLSKIVPKQGVVQGKKVVCVYKANESNKTGYTPVHTVVTSVKAVAPVLQDAAADFILSFIEADEQESAKQLLNEGVQQGLNILEAKVLANFAVPTPTGEGYDDVSDVLDNF